MIRINLLPRTRKQSRAAAAAPVGSSQLWGGAYLVALVIWCIVLAAVFFTYGNTLEEQQRANGVLQRQIEDLRTKSARLDEVRTKIDESRRLEQLVDELNRARLGPTRVLMEVSRILSADGGPTIDPQALEQLRRENPLAGFNRSWDPRRLWMTSFTEENRECRIAGQGKTNEDVAEFLQRLGLSEVFESVTLTKTESAEEAETHLPVIAFELTCRVRY